MPSAARLRPCSPLIYDQKKFSVPSCDRLRASLRLQFEGNDVALVDGSLHLDDHLLLESSGTTKDEGGAHLLHQAIPGEGMQTLQLPHIWMTFLQSTVFRRPVAA